MEKKKKETLNIFQKDEKHGFLTQPQIFITVYAYELVTAGFVLFLHKYDSYYVYLHLILFHKVCHTNNSYKYSA